MQITSRVHSVHTSLPLFLPCANVFLCGSRAGHPPDFVAFVITLLMMLLMAAGVKKSLLFTNVLNVVNLSVWVFIMAAGLFYVNSDNWAEHDGRSGFIPFGWSGVSWVFSYIFFSFERCVRGRLEL